MNNYQVSFLQQIKQAMALISVNSKSFPKRAVSSFVTLLSIACVAGVILSVLAMTDGMMKTLERTGLNNTLLVMRSGAVSELQSVLFPMEVNLLKNHQQVLRDKNGQSLVSAEMFVNAEYKALDKLSASQKLSLRGISKNTYYFRPNFHMVSGKKFNTGLREVIIGQAMARRMPEFTVGSFITLGGTQWKISGIFADKNSIFESEIWADIGVVQSDYQRGNTIQSVRLAMKTDTDISMLEKEWRADPRLNLRVVGEKQFFAQQGENLTRLIRWIGFPVAFVMAIGAMIAALNTMYAAIAARSKEIATQKAMGFSPFAISGAIMCEALFLAALGTSLGVLPLYLVFDGWTAATQDVNNFSQMMFNFEMTIELICQTFLLSMVIGLVGGILPALKAMNLPVTVALRDN
ncbi:ABC transporter permease [Colwelliaceae bacterium 6441]